MQRPISPATENYILLTDICRDRHIIDSLGKVLAVLATPSNDLGYQKSFKAAFSRMKEESAKVKISAKDLNHSRGHNFAGLRVGLSYGLGHLRPTCPKLGRFAGLAKALLEDVNIQCLATYQDGEFK